MAPPGARLLALCALSRGALSAPPARVRCDAAGHTCDAGTTCCATVQGSWGCCLGVNASCCSDMVHCCPSAWPVCQTNGKCTKADRAAADGPAVPWRTKLPALNATRVGGVGVRRLSEGDGREGYAGGPERGEGGRGYLGGEDGEQRRAEPSGEAGEYSADTESDGYAEGRQPEQVRHWAAESGKGHVSPSAAARQRVHGVEYSHQYEHGEVRRAAQGQGQ